MNMSNIQQSEVNDRTTGTVSPIEFVDELPENSGINKAKRTSQWDVLISPLVEHPLKWAKLFTGLSMNQAVSKAAYLPISAAARVKHLSTGGKFEGTTAKMKDGTFNVYGRFVPKEEAE